MLSHLIYRCKSLFYELLIIKEPYIMIEKAIEIAMNKGNTDLMIALNYGDIEITKILIKRTTNLNSQNNEGYTALMLASFYSSISPEPLKLLLKAGANIYLKNKHGETAFGLCNEEIKKYFTNFVMLQVWTIRNFSRNKMQNAFSIYNVSVNVFLFLQPK